VISSPRLRSESLKPAIHLKNLISAGSILVRSTVRVQVSQPGNNNRAIITLYTFNRDSLRPFTLRTPYNITNEATPIKVSPPSLYYYHISQPKYSKRANLFNEPSNLDSLCANRFNSSKYHRFFQEMFKLYKGRLKSSCTGDNAQLLCRERR